MVTCIAGNRTGSAVIARCFSLFFFSLVEFADKALDMFRVRCRWLAGQGGDIS